MRIESITAEALCDDRSVLVAMRDGKVVTIDIPQRDMEQDRLAGLGSKILQALDKAMENLAEAAASAVDLPESSPEEQQLLAEMDEFLDDYRRRNPQVERHDVEPWKPSTVEEQGFTLRLDAGLIVGIDIHDEVSRWTPRELEMPLRDAINQTFENLEPTPDAEPPAIEDLREIVDRIRDLKRGIYR